MTTDSEKKNESLDECLERVQLMAEGSPTWDLSDNDQFALRTTLLEIIHLRERIDDLTRYCEDSEKAIRACPALKEWGPSTPEHLASRVNNLCRLYDSCVHTLRLVADQRDAAIAANIAEFEGHKLTIADNTTKMDRIRAAMVSVFGGMGKGSAIWGQGQWDKGWTAGIQAALLAFDTERNNGRV